MRLVKGVLLRGTITRFCSDYVLDFEIPQKAIYGIMTAVLHVDYCRITASAGDTKLGALQHSTTFADSVNTYGPSCILFARSTVRIADEDYHIMAGYVSRHFHSLSAVAGSAAASDLAIRRPL